jgi:predicted amidohydrolase YtcJ
MKTQHHFYFITSALLFTLTLLITASAPAAEKEKLTNYVLMNGNVITMDKKDTRAQAIAVKDGRIFEVGKNSEMEKFVRQGWQKIDLKGKTVLPGFIDSHSHLDLKA